MTQHLTVNKQTKGKLCNSARIPSYFNRLLSSKHATRMKFTRILLNFGNDVLFTFLVPFNAT